MKRWIHAGFAVSLFLILAGCAADTGQRYAYPLATASPEDTVTQIYAEKFAEEVDVLSGGRIKIQVYANSVLGGDREFLESCYDGDIPFVVQNTAPQVNFIPDTAVFDAPCLFENLDEVRDMVELQQHTIDAQENPYEVIVSNRLYEQQDYVVNTNHLPHLISLIVSEKFFGELSEEDRMILMRAQKTAKDYSRKASDERISERAEEIEKNGTKIIDLDAKTREDMVKASVSVYKDIRKNVFGKIADQYMGTN